MVDESPGDPANQQAPDRVQPIPIPWTIEIGSVIDGDGDVLGVLDIYTFQGHTRLFFAPEFGIESSNYWHNASVKMKARQKGGGKLLVAETDLRGLDLGHLRNGEDGP